MSQKWVTVTVEITDELKRKCEETGKRLENFIDPDDPKMILDSDDLAAIEENTGIIIDENEMPTLSEIMALSSVLEPNESKTATEKNKLWMHSFGTEKPGNNAYAMQNSITEIICMLHKMLMELYICPGIM